jgi:hypothetical protein
MTIKLHDYPLLPLAFYLEKPLWAQLSEVAGFESLRRIWG